MAVGRKPGTPKTGGRLKGTANKSSLDVAAKLARVGCDPIIGMATIANNELPCGVCRGVGKTRRQIPQDQRPICDHQDPITLRVSATNKCLWCSGSGIREIDVRTCQSCYGTLFEACSPELRGKMHAELSQYVEAKRKAVEYTSPDGTSPLGGRLEVVFVDRKPA